MGILEILCGEEPGPIKKLLNYKNKGQFGEYLIEFAITNHNVPGQLYVFRNLYVPYQQGYSEIDLLLLHDRGIFVFESKNYSGWIFGSETDLQWTQTFPNGEKYHFYNPIRQNRKHIKALSAFLNLPVNCFFSCIVFSERCFLQSIPYSSEFVVLQRSDVLNWLRYYLEQHPIIYTYQQLTEWVSLLSPIANASSAERAEHIDQITHRFTSQVCPFCGSPLVLRHGKFGTFWGCSAYPKCKFTRSAET